MYAEYPKWVKVNGSGDTQNPGFVLVETENEEREILSLNAADAKIVDDDAADDDDIHDELDREIEKPAAKQPTAKRGRPKSAEKTI